MSKGWDNTALKKLKALVGKGLSTSEIGRRLGMSKNAIVGKLNRLGWNAKAGSSTEKKPAAKKATTTTTKTKTTAKGPAKKTVTVKTPAKKAPAKKESVKTPATKKAAAPKAATKEKPATTTPKKESAKSSAKNLAMHQRIIQHSLEMASLKPNQCRWPIGDPDSENFHFCGKTVFTGKPYCYEHCRLAYQFTPPKKKQ